jgi:hypothetical protein
MKLRNILIGAVALSALASSAFAQVNATAATEATIIRALTIDDTQDMSFGTIVRPAANATVSLSTAGAVTGVTTVGTGQAAAKFLVSGEGGQTFSIAQTISLGGPSTLVVTPLLAAGASGSIAGAVGTLSGNLGEATSGTAELVYGASFPITATTATGAYTGSLVVTVNYN